MLCLKEGRDMVTLGNAMSLLVLEVKESWKA